MKETPPDSLSGIYEFRQIDDRLGTAGQPTAAQFPMIRAAGFEAVVNLALPTSDNALAEEGGIVTGLGMAYAHIPVNFQAPDARDFQMFCGVMEALQGRRVFVHCAANMRVSAFVFLHRILRQGIAVRAAELDLHAVWQPDGVWAKFIEDQLRPDWAIHQEPEKNSRKRAKRKSLKQKRRAPKRL